MQLAELVDLSAQVASTRARNEKITTLATALAAAPASERALVSLYLAGRLRQTRIGVGPALLHAARAVRPAAHASVSLADVDATFAELASVRGKGAAARRDTLLGALFTRCTSAEQQYLTGLVTGDLRQGALESLLVDAIAQAAQVPADTVRRAQMLAADLPAVVHAAFTAGGAGLARFDLELFRPVQPMLASPADDPAAALAELGRAAFEWKLDGVRCQVHRRGDDVRVFSRTQNDITAAVPELVAVVLAMPAHELVLDGEVLALAADGRPLRFQETMQRFGRQRELRTAAAPLSSFFFDCMYRDGASLLDAPTAQRHAALASVVAAANLVPRIVTDDQAEADRFLADALARGHEGVMAKDLAAPYAAGRRGASWLKIKHTHTLDLVVLAAEWGSGRRSGLLSNLHLGARDATNGGFVMLGKTFKGLTDELLRFQTDALLAREVRRDATTVHVRPELVVEIAFNDVQTSSHYPGGMALRFARVKRYRPDKTAADADTLEQVRALHAAGDRPDGDAVE